MYLHGQPLLHEKLISRATHAREIRMEIIVATQDTAPFDFGKPRF